MILTKDEKIGFWAEIPPQFRDLILSGPKDRDMKDYRVDMKGKYNPTTGKGEITGWTLFKKNGDSWRKVNWNESLR
jgi:hypothetical protein